MWPNHRQHQLDANQLIKESPLELIITKNEQPKLLTNIRHLDKKLLKISSKICHLNLFQEMTGASIHSKIFSWTSLFILANLYSCLGMMKTLYYQYVRDFYEFQLESRMEDLPTGINLTEFEGASDLADLLKQVELKRSQLREAGAPLFSAPIWSAESFYILWLIDFTCICGYGYCRFRLSDHKLRTTFIRLMTSPEEEQKRLLECMLAEANEYLESNFNYIETYTAKNLKWFAGDDVDTLTPGAELTELILDYQRNVRILSHLIGQRFVLKVYKFSIWRLNLTCLYHLVSYNAGLLFLINPIIIMAVFNDKFGPESSPGGTKNNGKTYKDIEAIMQPLLVMSTTMFTASVFAIIIIIDWWDQAELVNRLRCLILDCVHLNEKNLQLWPDKHENNRRLLFCERKQFKLPIEMSESKEEQLILNANLLFVLINYKFFLKETRRALEGHKDSTTTYLIIMCITPLVIRAHTPYCSAQVRFYLLVCVLVNSFLTTIWNLPTCHLYSKCLQLHKPLASLLGHVIRFNDSASISVGHLYSAHGVWCLRKEMMHLDRFDESFLPKRSYVSIMLTYKNLIKLQFWLHLVTLSIMFQTESGGQLLADPLGLLGDKFLAKI